MLLDILNEAGQSFDVDTLKLEYPVLAEYLHQYIIPMCAGISHDILGTVEDNSQPLKMVCSLYIHVLKATLSLIHQDSRMAQC